MCHWIVWSWIKISNRYVYLFLKLETKVQKQHLISVHCIAKHEINSFAIFALGSCKHTLLFGRHFSVGMVWCAKNWFSWPLFLLITNKTLHSIFHSHITTIWEGFFIIFFGINIYPVDDVHGCWTKFKQNPRLFDSAGAELPSAPLVCTLIVNGFVKPTNDIT